MKAILRMSSQRLQAFVSILSLLAVSAAAAESVMGVADLAKLPRPEPDHVIAYGERAQQFGELTLPKGEGPFPVAVLIHGGCWLSSHSVDYFRALSEAISALGFAVWSIEYRRVGDPDADWPATFSDVAKAADAVRRTDIQLSRRRPSRCVRPSL